jgi:hypothetical protein
MTQADCASALSDLTMDMGKAHKASQSVASIILRLLSAQGENKSIDPNGLNGTRPHVSCSVPASFPWKEVLASLPLWGTDEAPGTGVGEGGRAESVGARSFDLDSSDAASDYNASYDTSAQHCALPSVTRNRDRDNNYKPQRASQLYDPLYSIELPLEGVGSSDIGCRTASSSDSISPNTYPQVTPDSVGGRSNRPTRTLRGLAGPDGLLSVSIPSATSHLSSASTGSSSPINGSGGNLTPRRMRVNLAQSSSDAFSVIISPQEPYSPTTIHGLSTISRQRKNAGGWLASLQLQLLGTETSPKVKSPHPHPNSHSSPKTVTRKTFLGSVVSDSGSRSRSGSRSPVNMGRNRALSTASKSMDGFGNGDGIWTDAGSSSMNGNRNMSGTGNGNELHPVSHDGNSEPRHNISTLSSSSTSSMASYLNATPNVSDSLLTASMCTGTESDFTCNDRQCTGAGAIGEGGGEARGRYLRDKRSSGSAESDVTALLEGAGSDALKDKKSVAFEAANNELISTTENSTSGKDKDDLSPDQLNEVDINNNSSDTARTDSSHDHDANTTHNLHAEAGAVVDLADLPVNTPRRSNSTRPTAAPYTPTFSPSLSMSPPSSLPYPQSQSISCTTPLPSFAPSSSSSSSSSSALLMKRQDSSCSSSALPSTTTTTSTSSPYSTVYPVGSTVPVFPSLRNPPHNDILELLSPSFSPYSTSSSPASSTLTDPFTPNSLSPPDTSRSSEKKHNTVPPIRMASNEEDFMDGHGSSIMGAKDGINNGNKSEKDDSKSLNESGSTNATDTDTEMGAGADEEDSRILLLPLDSLFEENKTCQQTLINFGR